MRPVCHLISYASANFADQQARLLKTLHYLPEPKIIHSFGPEDIDPQYRADHADVLSQPRGGGYWLWKPYLIDMVMSSANLGDIVFYMDSGSKLVSSAAPLLDLVSEIPCGILSFGLKQPERECTKRLAFVELGVDTPEHRDSPQRLATFMLLRVTPETRAFVKEWLACCEDARLVTDMPSPMGEAPEFIQHQHDQSLFSLLCKKHGIPAQLDPCQYGNGELERDSLYPQIILCTRTVRPGSKRWIKMHCISPLNKMDRFLRKLGWRSARFSVPASVR